MHECPDCGQVCDCDGENVWSDAGAADCRCVCAEYDDDLDQDYEHDLDACVDCGSPSISDTCECCGEWLCYMHSEIGAGFCHSCPTQEWIDEQQKPA